MSRRCHYFIGRVAARTDGERVAESMGTGIFEARRLCYVPTGRKHPPGWRYSVGPFSTKKRVIQAVRFPGATAIIRGER